jgi:outer membrane receptor protein involved in Fe transport
MSVFLLKLSGIAFALAVAGNVLADVPAVVEEVSGDVLALQQVVVTATVDPRSKLRSSLAVSTLDAERIQESVPTNAADILRDIPGMNAQASGGEGNANVTVRGLPVTGGAKFVQFQEDGLPVLDFGDIEFATPDTFLRADYNIARVEVVRGGTAATLASNGPAAVVNFLSKTGEVEGGNFAFTRGVDFDRTRLDFDYGQHLSEEWMFHVGGFYRTGEGPKELGHGAESGGQIKGNITRRFTQGYVRISFKVLDERTPVWLPVPVSLMGTNSDAQFESLPGFSVLHGAMQSPYFLRDLAVDQNGNRVSTDIADGYRSSSRAFGAEAGLKLPGDWKLTDRFRVAATSGRFVGPFPAEVNTAAALAAELGGPGAALRYATGPFAGQALANDQTVGDNGLAVQTLLFNVTLNDLGNSANDLQLSRAFQSEGFGSATLTLGYFKSRQNIGMDWHWNTYLEQVLGKNAALLDVVDAQGSLLTQQGLVAYGEPVFGNCCIRSYQLHYDTDAPYLSLNWQGGPWDIDGSLRYDISAASGIYSAANGTTTLDVNNDGLIQVPEEAVPVANSGGPSPVNYTVRYLSYSLGANYLLNPELALFARLGEGGRANATRLLFGGGIRPSGDIAEQVAVNKVRLYEGGLKWNGDALGFFATAFYARTQVTDQDITTRSAPFSRRLFRAWGLEIEGGYALAGFRLNAGLTYTNGKISADQITPEDVGQRIAPDYIYQLTGAYAAGRWDAGLNLIGVSANPDPSTQVVLPAFVQVNAFVSYELTHGLRLGVRGNNILNTAGFTETQATSIPDNRLATARSIVGRTIEATLKYSF